MDAAPLEYVCQHGSGSGMASKRGGDLSFKSAFILSALMTSSAPAQSSPTRYLPPKAQLTAPCQLDCPLLQGKNVRRSAVEFCRKTAQERTPIRSAGSPHLGHWLEPLRLSIRGRPL